MKNASVPPNTMWCLLLYTVRYAMGRMSSAPSDAADWVRQYRKHLTAQQIEQIAEEVETELRVCERQGRTLGMDCDHKVWAKLVKDLRS